MFCSLSLADSFIFLTLTRLVVVFIFVNFSFALFTPPLGDYQVAGTVGRLDVGALTQPLMCPERGYVSLVSVCSFSYFAPSCL